MTLQHIQDSNSHSEEPALEARPADVVEAESYRSGRFGKVSAVGTNYG